MTAGAPPMPQWATRLYYALDTDIGMVRLGALMRVGALVSLLFYFVSPLRGAETEPASGATLAALVLFGLYSLAVAWLAIHQPTRLRASLWMLARIGVDILFYTTFYWLSGEARADLYLLYLLPLFASVHFLVPFSFLIVLGLVSLAFSITLASLAYQNGFDIFEFLRILLARNAVLGVLTVLQAFRRRHSLLADVNQHGPLRTALDAYAQGVCIVDHAQRVVMVNEFLRQRHGPHRPAQQCADYFGCIAEQCTWCRAASTRHPGERDHQQVVRRLQRQAGGYYYANLSSIPMLNEQGRAVGAIAFISDISEQRLQARQLTVRLALSQGQLQSLEQERAKWLEMITELGKRLSGLVDQAALFAFVVEESRWRLSAEVATLFLIDEESGRLTRRATAGVDSRWLPDEHYAIGEGIVGSTLATVPGERYGRPIRTDKADVDPLVAPATLNAYRSKLPSGQVKHVLTVPLNGQLRSFGVLRLLNKLDASGNLVAEGFSREDEDFLTTIAAMVAIAVENAQLLTTTTRYMDELKAIHAASQAAVSTQQLDDVLRTIVEVAGRVAGSVHTGVVLADEQGRLLSSVEDHPLEPGLHCRARPGGKTERIIRERTPYWCEDTTLHPQEHNDIILRKGYQSYAGLPIVGRSTVHGALFVHSHEPHAFARKAELLQIFCNHVATALDNASQFGQLDEAARTHARQQLSEEVHDSMNFVQGALVLGTAHQLDLLESGEIAAAQDNAERLNKAALHTYRTLRWILHEVRDPILQAQGLIPALRRHVELLRGEPITIDGDERQRLPAEIEHGMYRIAQEAVHNAHKHSSDDVPTQVTVALHVESNHYQLVISDTGPGFEVAAALARSDSYGLQSMQRWAQALDAVIEWHSQPGQGTRVVVMGALA
jgi:signal transduction histidine kinase/PAS domain-containing protein